MKEVPKGVKLGGPLGERGVKCPGTEYGHGPICDIEYVYDWEEEILRDKKTMEKCIEHEFTGPEGKQLLVHTCRKCGTVVQMMVIGEGTYVHEMWQMMDFAKQPHL